MHIKEFLLNCVPVSRSQDTFLEESQVNWGAKNKGKLSATRVSADFSINSERPYFEVENGNQPYVEHILAFMIVSKEAKVLLLLLDIMFIHSMAPRNFHLVAKFNKYP